MSYNPNYPGGYPNYPANCGQPVYPTSYPPATPYPATGYPATVPSNTRTDVYIKEDRRCGETVTTITETSVPAVPQPYIPPPAPVTRETIVIEERHTSRGDRGLEFAAGMAVGMATEAIIETLK